MLRFHVGLGCLSWDKIYVVCVLSNWNARTSNVGQYTAMTFGNRGLVVVYVSNCIVCVWPTKPGRDGDIDYGFILQPSTAAFFSIVLIGVSHCLLHVHFFH